MSDWTSGYVAEIGYTYGCYNELNPNRATLALLNAGYAPPPSGVHCELGFGQGLSINVHAAASGSTWHGTDFNPSQAAFAQSLARASGADAHLTDEAFADFCTRTDLPDFDSIGLHGIWSWISDENRSIIVDFIHRKLKVGGALYISYNTQPGWAAFAPMRHLMTEHASVMGSPGKGVVSRVDGALEFAQKLLDTNPLFARSNPAIAERLKKTAAQDRHYLAHEYFNKDWHPMHFASMSQWLSPAKIDFACSAHYLDHIDALNLTAEQQALLKEIPDATFKESVRDFMVNQQFRRDYWIKGARKLSVIEQVELIKEQRIVLIIHKEELSLKISGSIGTASMADTIYVPIVDLMADYKCRSIYEIATHVKENGILLSQVVQAVMVLIGAGYFATAQSETEILKSKKLTLKLNRFLLQKSLYSKEISYLASPVTGGGILVNRFQQLFILSSTLGEVNPLQWAKFVWSTLKSQNEKVMKNGKILESVDENITELALQAEYFSDRKIKILKALQIIN
jgi:hypothetical protein